MSKHAGHSDLSESAGRRWNRLRTQQTAHRGAADDLQPCGLEGAVMGARTKSADAVKFAERPLSALDAIYVRRSVRSYTSERLDRSTVEALLDAAIQAPTAMHEEPWTFAV